MKVRRKEVSFFSHKGQQTKKGIEQQTIRAKHGLQGHALSACLSPSCFCFLSFTNFNVATMVGIHQRINPFILGRHRDLTLYRNAITDISRTSTHNLQSISPSNQVYSLDWLLQMCIVCGYVRWIFNQLPIV